MRESVCMGIWVLARRTFEQSVSNVGLNFEFSLLVVL